jgi:hypothetical protein
VQSLDRAFDTRFLWFVHTATGERCGSRSAAGLSIDDHSIQAIAVPAGLGFGWRVEVVEGPLGALLDPFQGSSSTWSRGGVTL